MHHFEHVKNLGGHVLIIVILILLIAMMFGKSDGDK